MPTTSRSRIVRATAAGLASLTATAYTLPQAIGAAVDDGKNLRKLKHYVEQDAPRP
ncbi:hypothetical protein [Streptomyces sp. NPDC056723]|uniref:hypothetical protein n=1 Tax=Streptomyces sp. NPDC056723 TaxID=3345925 RepID=UPI0036A48504